MRIEIINEVRLKDEERLSNAVPTLKKIRKASQLRWATIIMIASVLGWNNCYSSNQTVKWITPAMKKKQNLYIVNQCWPRGAIYF